MKLLETIKDSVYTIAEMSANHAGSLDNALELVRAANDAGADCLKIQTYTADTLTLDCDNEYFRIKGGLWDGYKLYDLYKEAATPWEWQAEIKAECDRVGIDFLSTPFDETAVDFLEELGVEAYKIASFELVHIPLLKYVAKKGKPVILSCGMGTVDEIAEAIAALTGEGLAKEQIILLKCTSEYPADPVNMNLSTIPDLAERFGVQVGLSDHSLGVLAPVTAVALGACIVEKHFCLRRDLKNPDSDFSSEPDELAEMVKAVKAARAAVGSPFYGPTESERGSVVFRRSVFAARDIEAGEAFTLDNVRVVRPGYGCHPREYGRLLGSICAKAYKRGSPIQSNDERDN